MLIYSSVLFGAVVIAHCGRRYGSVGVERLALFLSISILVFFAGLRDKAVGTDTPTYVGFLNKITSVDDVFGFKVEPGFNALVLLSGKVGDSYAFLLGIIAGTVVVLYMCTIVRLAKRYETGLFIFITLGAYTFFFNGARQGLATAICFFALPWLLERKAVPYFLLVGFATLFHKTALAAIPLYFLATARVGWRELLVVVVSAGVMASFLSMFAQFTANFIDEKYASYGQKGEGGGHLKVAFLFGQGALLLLFKRQVSDPNGYYGRLLNIYLLGLIPALASVIGNVNPSGVLRLTTYFSHAAILLWPMIFLSFRNAQSKAVVSAGFLLVALAFFIMTTSTFSNLTPYRINSELFW
jgi:hypothetical protein